MPTFDRTEILLGSEEHSCSITEEFDHCEREKSLECSLADSDVSTHQTITDCHGRTYLVTDVIVSDDRSRKVRVTPIDLDGHEF